MMAIKGFTPKDEELIMNLVSALMECTAEERKTLLQMTLHVAIDSKMTILEDGDLTAGGLFVGALRELIVSFEGE